MTGRQILPSVDSALMAFGGAHLLMERVTVDRVYVPDFSDEKGIRKTVEQVAGARLHTVTEAITLEGEDYSLSVIPAEAPRSENESSLCILFQGENCDILITGDRNTTGEKALLAQADIPDIEVLVAGHHGSESSTGMEFLYETQPEYVVISVGADNNYGHPDPNLLERLRIFGCQVLRTDEKGTIVLRW